MLQSCSCRCLYRLVSAKELLFRSRVCHYGSLYLVVVAHLLVTRIVWYRNGESGATARKNVLTRMCPVRRIDYLLYGIIVTSIIIALLRSSCGVSAAEVNLAKREIVTQCFTAAC